MSDSSDRLLRSLMQEFFQTETSAALHCRREAEHHAHTPLSQALREVAKHADEVLRKLPELAAQSELPISKLGIATGTLFSEVRERIFDRALTAERSYRATLLGVRHGVDLVKSLRHAAEVEGNLALFEFSESWLLRRTILMDRVEEELAWFARHPEAATRSAKARAPSPAAEEAGSPRAN